MLLFISFNYFKVPKIQLFKLIINGKHIQLDLTYPHTSVLDDIADIMRELDK